MRAQTTKIGLLLLTVAFSASAILALTSGRIAASTPPEMTLQSVQAMPEGRLMADLHDEPEDALQCETVAEVRLNGFTGKAYSTTALHCG